MAALDPVAETAWLFRRSFSDPARKYCNPDGTATSRAFKLRPKDEGKLSVDVKSMTCAAKAIKDASKHFLFELSNSDVLAITNPQLMTYHDPLPDGSNNAHAVIVGMAMEDEITPGLLARASRRVM
jgi:hypothetical protein